MSATIDQTTATAVFEAAAASRDWKTTNLGERVPVRHGRYTYWVEISAGYLAAITGRDGFGGGEYIEGANATQAQHRQLVAAAGAVKANRRR